jgi:hypothetical protein
VELAAEMPQKQPAVAARKTSPSKVASQNQSGERVQR